MASCLKRLVFVLCLLPQMLWATDLMMVYHDASANDPTLKAQAATREAANTSIMISTSLYLPQLSLTASSSYNQLDEGNINGNYTANALTATVIQPLINFNQMATISNSYHTADAANDTYLGQQESFLLQVAKDYFAVLEAEENVAFAKSQLEALAGTYLQTKAQFQVGLATYVSLAQAKANYDSAKATLIQKQTVLVQANENLMELTNKPEPNLIPLSDQFQFLRPLPNDINYWVQQALSHNPTLNSQRKATLAARDVVLAGAGNQLPVVSLVGTYAATSYSHDTPAVVSTTLNPKNTTIGLQLTWTIFNGGANFATTLQAAKLYEAAQDAELNQYRQTVSQTKQDFLNVISSIHAVRAYQQAIVAGESSLAQYQAQYKVGTATIVDVLNQVQTVYQAKFNLSQVEYDYIASLLALKADAGSLSAQDLSTLNGQLQANT